VAINVLFILIKPDKKLLITGLFKFK